MLREDLLFVLFRLSSSWRSPTPPYPHHIMDRDLLYSRSTGLNVNLISNTLTETSSIMFDHISGHHGPAKLTCKINPRRDIKRKRKTRKRA